MNSKEPGSKFQKIKKYGKLADTGSGGIRPHVNFDKIKHQLGDKCNIIWKGYLIEENGEVKLKTIFKKDTD